MLAVLNMILMGDGSSCILNEDSLTYFDSGSADEKRSSFPADVFILNPPYSAPGNGMVFVQSALGRMNKGYAAVIIQNSAGSGKAVEYNREILKRNTLLASIKMPVDLFLGRSSVQTNIYVFRVGERHEKDSPVKFIDFSNDGYTRTNRKKARVNLRDTDHAAERYEELVSLVKFGRSKLRFFTDKEYYEGTIDPANGKDWNQSAPIDRKLMTSDFRTVVSDYLAWEITNVLKRGGKEKVSEKQDDLLDEGLSKIAWKKFSFREIFNQIHQGRRLKKEDQESGNIPFVMAGRTNTGVANYISNPVSSFPKNAITVDIFGNAFYRGYDFGAGDDTGVYWNDEKTYSSKVMLFFTMAMQKALEGQFSYGNKLRSSQSLDFEMILPVKNDEIDFNFMECFIMKLEKECIEKVKTYLKTVGLMD